MSNPTVPTVAADIAWLGRSFSTNAATRLARADRYVRITVTAAEDHRLSATALSKAIREASTDGTGDSPKTIRQYVIVRQALAVDVSAVDFEAALKAHQAEKAAAGAARAESPSQRGNSSTDAPRDAADNSTATGGAFEALTPKRSHALLIAMVKASASWSPADRAIVGEMLRQAGDIVTNGRPATRPVAA